MCSSLFHLSEHFSSVTVAKLEGDALAGYVAWRKAGGAGNRTVNIEVGVLLKHQPHEGKRRPLSRHHRGTSQELVSAEMLRAHEFS